MKEFHPLGPPKDPRYGPTVGSSEGDVSYERGNPVGERRPSPVACHLIGKEFQLENFMAMKYTTRHDSCQ